MAEGYRHEGGSNRACDREGNLIGWLVFTGPDRSGLRVVDREGNELVIDRTAEEYTVRTESGEVRKPRTPTRDDPYYLGLADDGQIRVYVDGEGKLRVPLKEFERASGKR